MAAISTLPWKTSYLRATISNQVFYHVKPSTVLRRQVHTSSRNLFITRDKRADLIRCRDDEQDRQRMVSISIDQHSSTPDETFFEICGTLRPKLRVWERFWYKKPLTLLVMYTPGFTPWLNDNTFIPKILKQLFYSNKDAQLVTFTVLYACVDGIAPRIDNGSPHGQSATQGFSIMYARKMEWSGKSIRGQPVVPVIRFCNLRSEVNVPLANTLFHTGRPSESVVSQWEARNGEIVEVRKREHKSMISILGPINSGEPLNSFIPARPITHFRKIKAGVGNIIRTLEFEGGDSGPASQELEKAVSSISESLGGVTVDVWALIIPPNVFSSGLEKMPQPGPEYVGFWLDRGARICRVVSGGGGWGPKQGLLSLDQDTELQYKKSPDPESGPSDEEDILNLGNLAEEGASIQFLAFDDSAATYPMSSNIKQPISLENNIVFGTIPSTIDEIPQENSDNGSEPAKYDYRPNHFGCVSGSGIYYAHRVQAEDQADEMDLELSGKLNDSSSLEEEKSQRDSSVWEDFEPMSSKEDSIEDKEQSRTPLQTTKLTLPYSYLYLGGLRIRKHVTTKTKQNTTALGLKKSEHGEHRVRIRKHVTTKGWENIPNPRERAMERQLEKKLQIETKQNTNALSLKKSEHRERRVKIRHVPIEGPEPPQNPRGLAKERLLQEQLKIETKQNMTALGLSKGSREIRKSDPPSEAAPTEGELMNLITNYKGQSPLSSLLADLLGEDKK